MPSTPEQWAWFAFFAGGALGGWLILAALVGDVVLKWWRRR